LWTFRCKGTSLELIELQGTVVLPTLEFLPGVAQRRTLFYDGSVEGQALSAGMMLPPLCSNVREPCRGIFAAVEASTSLVSQFFSAPRLPFGVRSFYGHPRHEACAGFVLPEAELDGPQQARAGRPREALPSALPACPAAMPYRAGIVGVRG